MMILVTGGSGSGKSAYAEDCMVRLSEGCEKYYLATMQIYGKEGQDKVERHRKLRSGKGFVTIEQPISIEKALVKMETEASWQGSVKGRSALLECMSNLVANEMFSGEFPQPLEVVAENVISGIEVLYSELKNLVIVTNNVFEDGIAYDEGTMQYIQALGHINERLAKLADQVIEVVVGIPVVVKGEM